MDTEAAADALGCGGWSLCLITSQTHENNEWWEKGRSSPPSTLSPPPPPTTSLPTLLPRPLILPFLPSFFYSFLPLFIRSFLFLILPSAVTFLFLCETLTSALYDAQRRPAAEAERRGRMTMLSGGKQNTRHSRGQGGEGEVSAMAQLYRWLQSEST